LAFLFFLMLLFCLCWVVPLLLRGEDALFDGELVLLLLSLGRKLELAFELERFEDVDERNYAISGSAMMKYCASADGLWLMWCCAVYAACGLLLPPGKSWR
jgi:hypothetical protein